ncbi:MAG: restriction endonuclease subunit S [Desulfococcaceae bacterium]
MKLKKDKWKVIELIKVVDIVNGSTPKAIKTAVENGTYPFLRVNDMNLDGNEIYIKNCSCLLTKQDIDKFKIKLYPKGTLIFPKRGASIHTNKKRILLQDSAIDLNTMGFVPSNKIDYYFLFIWFQTINLSTIADGSYIPQINSRNINGIEILLPPLEEQKQIAALFQSIETAMEQVDGQEKNLLNLKKQLLCDLFGENLKFGNSLNKNDFQKIKFEKIALNISERVEPQKTNLDTYVGLEHLDPENLAITRTGKPDDVIGTKLKIYKGDIIFGKRRAYQRKISVSHFDGIASAHSMILRANEKHIEKDFLPFFMQSDVFMNRAIQISEGSLSPTIKWKTLAAQEFILPKKEKQKKLTEVFKQFDITLAQLRQQKTTLRNLKQKLLSEILG